MPDPIKAVQLADLILDCIPIISSISNAAQQFYCYRLAQKVDILNPAAPGFKESFRIHVLNKSRLSRFIGFIPILGNIVKLVHLVSYLIEAKRKTSFRRNKEISSENQWNNMPLSPMNIQKSHFKPSPLVLNGELELAGLRYLPLKNLSAVQTSITQMGKESFDSLKKWDSEKKGFFLGQTQSEMANEQRHFFAFLFTLWKGEKKIGNFAQVYVQEEPSSCKYLNFTSSVLQDSFSVIQPFNVKNLYQDIYNSGVCYAFKGLKKRSVRNNDREPYDYLYIVEGPIIPLKDQIQWEGEEADCQLSPEARTFHEERSNSLFKGEKVFATKHRVVCKGNTVMLYVSEDPDYSISLYRGE